MVKPLVVGLLLMSIPGYAQFPSESERLMATARLWTTIDYFSPDLLACGDSPWYRALQRAIPKIRAASNAAEFKSAIADLLSILPASNTFVVPEGEPIPDLQQVPVSTQQNIAHTATAKYLMTRDQGHADRIVLDVSGVRVSVGLSMPVDRPLHPHTCMGMQMIEGKDLAYPLTEDRIIAAIQLWGTIHYFFAYKDLMDEDWDELLSAFFSKVINAKDALEYNLVLADLLTHLTDTNVTQHSKTLDHYFGETPVGLRIRLLDKYPVISDVLDPAAKAAGVELGDVVKRIDGVSTTEIFRRLVQYIPASTPQRSGYDTVQKVSSGLVDSEVELMIENAQGEAHPVKLKRIADSSLPQRSSEAINILAGNIGYLDLERIALKDVEAALDRLKSTRGIIFDLRASSAPAAAQLARHLTSQSNVAAALVTEPIALGPDIATEEMTSRTTNTFTVRSLGSSYAPLYKGKTVALIDERTIGEAEYAGLLFRAANKMEFIGAPSAGCDSPVGTIALPGLITITYSTEDIRDANGGKLQRLGLQPNVAAPTTAKGLHKGIDEPLAAALSRLAGE